MKRILILIAGLILLCMNAFADDVSIDSSGNVKTGVSNTNAELEVTGGSGEGGILGTTSGTGASGVYGINTSFGDFGILGYYGYGVYGYSPSGWAGYFSGNAKVTGNLTVDGSLIGPSIGDITGVTAGTGLSGGGTSGDVTLNVNTTAIQQRVTGTCAAGSSMSTVNVDGTVVCETDDGITSESDPQVGTLTSGKWCTSNGTTVDCTSNAPVTSESDPKVGTITTNYVPKWNGTALVTGSIYDNGKIGIGTASPNEQLEITGNLRLPATTATTGIIRSGANTLIHTYGNNNFFAGTSAGNLTMTGYYNTAIGAYTLLSNTTGYYNTASGVFGLRSNTTGYNNTATGHSALYANTTGYNNTAIGAVSLNSNTTGYENTATGYWALYSNTTGNGNTASGNHALYINTTGYENTAIGAASLASNTTGYYNTASGSLALFANTSGRYNTASGSRALSFNTEGEGNTASGYAALSSNTTGNNNTAVGLLAGYTATPGNANTSGSNNTFIGAKSGPGTSTQLTNATAIGYNALVSQSNSLVLGGTGSDAVNVGIGTSTPTDSLDVEGSVRVNDKDIYLRSSTDTNHGLGWYGSGKSFASTNPDGPVLYGFSGGALGTTNGGQKVLLSWTTGTFDFYGYSRFRVLSSGSTSACLDANNTISVCSSDARMKKDVVTLSDEMNVLDALSRLRGVTFTWNRSNPKTAGMTDKRDLGMIAQEVEQVFPEVVHTDSDGYKSMDYPKLVGFLVEVNKAQQEEIKDLREVTGNQQTQINELKKIVEELKEKL